MWTQLSLQSYRAQTAKSRDPDTLYSCSTSTNVEVHDHRPYPNPKTHVEWMIDYQSESHIHKPGQDFSWEAEEFVFPIIGTPLWKEQKGLPS